MQIKLRVSLINNKRILVLHSSDIFQNRKTDLDHTYCFDKFGLEYEYEYCNLNEDDIIRKLRKNYYAVIYHTSFFGRRWTVYGFFLNYLIAKLLKNDGSIKIAIPQDEFLKSESLMKFFRYSNVNVILTLLDPGEARRIYKINNSAIKIDRVLAGYYNGDQPKLSLTEENFNRKKTDLFYRSWVSAELGQWGIKKEGMASAFIGAQKNLQFDVNTEKNNLVYGDSWTSKLEESKFTLIIEGGASLIDPKGKIQKKVLKHRKRNPKIKEIELYKKLDLERYDNSLDLKCITPRVWEAIANGVALVGYTGSYNNILQADVHYLRIDDDFKNVPKIVENLNYESWRYLLENCYKLLESDLMITYRKFVTQIENEIGEFDFSKIKIRNYYRTFYSFLISIFLMIRQMKRSL
jgi:hypothetical protein